MVHAVVHIQQFINKRNVKYQPYKRMFGTKPCSVDSDTSTSHSDSDSHSSSNSNSSTYSDLGSSLTSCSPDPLLSEPNYSPDEEHEEQSLL